MQNGLFIGKFWAKIAVERWFYCWKTILAVGSKSRWNLIIGSWLYHKKSILAIGSNPYSIWGVEYMIVGGIGDGYDLGYQIMLKGEIKNRQFMAEISSKNRRFSTVPSDFFNLSVIYHIFFWYIIDLSMIFCWYFANFLPSDKSPWNIVSIPSDTWYIDNISSIYPDIFFHDWDYLLVVS